jgi:uncharacterized protein YdaU (DUF1376 family)
MDWYKKSSADYRNGTWGLSLAAHGAYNLLIDHYMLFESPLPADDRALASIVGCALDEWQKVRDEVLPFFKTRNALLTHKRCEAELEAAYTKRKDGQVRQNKHRKALKVQDSVTPPSRVSHVPRGEEKREEERREEKEEVSLRSTRARAQGNTPVVPQRVNGQLYELAFAAGWEAWRAVDMTKGSRFAAREAWRKLIEKPKLDPRPIVEAVSAYCLGCASTASKTQHMVTWIRQRGWETPYDEGVLSKENAIVGKHRHELALAWEKAYNAEVLALEDQNEEIEP